MAHSVVERIGEMKQDVTRMINAIENGDPHASEELLPLVYAELRRLAARKMAIERAGHTLQPTALVHEAYLRLVNPEKTPVQWEGRTHFSGAAAEAMRRFLIDRARRKARVRHGGAMQQADIDPAGIAAGPRNELLFAIDEALEELERLDPAKANVVKLRFFVGFTAAETADVLGLSLTTVERRWRFAKAWLLERMESSTPE